MFDETWEKDKASIPVPVSWEKTLKRVHLYVKARRSNYIKG